MKPVITNGLIIWGGSDTEQYMWKIKYARGVKKRLESGMDYTAASPMHAITREQAAWLLNVSWLKLQ